MITPHPEYTRNLPQWQRLRDCLEGELSVKARGVEYLPRLGGQSDEEYRCYLQRASFYGGAARLLEDCLAAAFRRSPVINLSGSGPAEEGLKTFAADCDLAGTEFLDYARTVLREVLGVGRAGSLVLWDS